MKTAPDIVSGIIECMIFRAFVHRAIDDCEFMGINAETCKEIRKHKTSVYQLRQSLDAIAADMIMRGEY